MPMANLDLPLPSNPDHRTASPATPRRHPTYWFDDGTLILQIQDILFKLHKSLLTRHSSVLRSLADLAAPHTVLNPDVNQRPPLLELELPQRIGVQISDFVRLLEHLYHDISFTSNRDIDRLGSVLRVSSKHQLDFPGIHGAARQALLVLYPTSLPPSPSLAQDADQALLLAVQYQVYPIQKALYYIVATNMQFEDHDVPSCPELMDPTNTTKAIAPHGIPTRCRDLLECLINHFTPILFTVATAGHMACTEVLADSWMPLVIQPALASNGVCRPIETIQSIADIDWNTHGLCAQCVTDKREEWRLEQEIIWKKLDDWLYLSNHTNETAPKV